MTTTRCWTRFILPAIDPTQAITVKANLPLVQGQNAQGSYLVAVLDATNVVPEVNTKETTLSCRR
jgi:hypothetical protein